MASNLLHRVPTIMVCDFGFRSCYCPRVVPRQEYQSDFNKQNILPKKKSTNFELKHECTLMKSIEI